MSRKVIGILAPTVFVIVAWYLYGMYPYIQNLIFALLATTITLVAIIVSYTQINSEDEVKSIDKGVDLARIIFSGIAFIMFFVFFALNIKYGGSASSAEDALSRYENYEVGEYYLSNHGNFILVSYNVWIRMKIVELIAIPAFIIMFIWNFIHIVKSKGWKYALSGREKDSR